ncbi:MAG: hypothetical protein ACI8RZ_007286, partial [Myxococcota bacterium]
MFGFVSAWTFDLFHPEETIMTHIAHIATLLLLLSSCSDVEEHDHDHHDQEVITTVTLTLTSQADGSILEYTWADPENDGDPVIDDVILLDAEDYDLSVSFLNALEEPAEDITAEIEDEGDEHQL